jgi:hypothetical protein
VTHGVTLFKMDDFKEFLGTFYTPVDKPAVVEEEMMSTGVSSGLSRSTSMMAMTGGREGGATIKKIDPAYVSDSDSETEEWMNHYHTMPARRTRNTPEEKAKPTVFDIFDIVPPAAPAQVA